MPNPPAARPDFPPTASQRTVWFWAGLLLLVVATFVIRLYKLDSIPAGLFWDEAYEGLDAFSLFGRPLNEWPIFFTAINGREPLFVYLVHLAQRIDGPTIWSVRVISAGAGALLTPALVWLGWEIAPLLGIIQRRRFALWSGLASLALLWPQTISRLGQRISLFGLLEVLACAALWRAWRTGRLRWWLLAGLLAGLSFYTYLAVRLLPFVFLPVALLLLWRERQKLWQARWGLLAFLLAALVTAGPLLLHFARQPDHFSMRTGQVNILAQFGLPGLLRNGLVILGMAFTGGDFNLRLNFPDRPVLDFFTVLPFLIGLLLALRHMGRPGYLFLLSGLGVLLIPTLLSEEAPNFGRSFGAYPFVVLLIALGVEWLSEAGRKIRPRLGTAIAFVGSGVLLLATLLAVRVYFVDWANHPQSFAAWDTGYTQVAEEILALRGAEPSLRVYAGPLLAENPSVEYLLADEEAGEYPLRFDGRVCVRVATDRPAAYYILSALDDRGEPLLRSFLPQSSARDVVWDTDGAVWARIIEQPTGGAVVFPEMQPQPVPLSDGIDLLGHQLFPPAGMAAGGTFYTRLYWQVSAPPAANYTAFAHLLRRNEAGDLVQLAGTDRPPGDGSCPTSEWLPGEVIVEEMQFVLPDNLPAGELFVAVGLYTPEDQQRLTVPGSPDNQVLIGPIKP
jgi:4-amino-4-deoxy-L-arabinose transferase-like glycosyltransferase